MYIYIYSIKRKLLSVLQSAIFPKPKPWEGPSAAQAGKQGTTVPIQYVFTVQITQNQKINKILVARTQ